MNYILNTGVNAAGSDIADNRYLFVANNNSYGIPNCDSVSVFDLKHNKIVTVINDKSFNQPYTVTVDSYRDIAYITNSNTPLSKGDFGTITKIDTKRMKVIGTIGNKLPEKGGMDGPSSFVIYDDKAYVCNYGGPAGLTSGFGKTVSVVDLNSEEIIDTVEVDQAPAAAAISTCGNYLYVVCYVDGNPGTGTLNIVSLRHNKVVKKVGGLFGPFAVVSVRNYVAVTNFGSNNFAPFGTTVAIINPEQGGIIKEVNIGIQPSGLALTPNGRYLVATCYNSLYKDPVKFTGLTAGMGSLVYIDTKEWKQYLPATFVGLAPGNVTISKNGKYTYVSNYIGNNVTIVENPELCR